EYIPSTSVWLDNRNMINIQFADGSTTSFHTYWLRDHCRCEKCFHSVTKQRLVETVEIPLDIRPASMELHEHEKKLKVTWANDGHQSIFDFAWLRTHSYNPRLAEEVTRKREKILWDGSLASNLPIVKYEDVMKPDDSGLAKWLEHIDTYGIGFVDGVPPTPEATQKVIERIAFIRESHYGKFWDFTANLEHGDAAYTTIALGAHTDTTYFTDPVGLQIFHLIENRAKGGSSLWVDGFHVAALLKKHSPTAYAALSTIR
ncbi:hypothetical protein HK102_010692, partial [Quaeritorhiza haematococci]